MESIQNDAPLVSETENETLPEHAILIDVRSPNEYKFSHLSDAILLTLNQISEKIMEVVPDKSSAIIVYCQSGIRSGIAKAQLNRLGYSQVFNGGGIESLSNKNRYKVVVAT